jgi:hypothetical protein
VELGDLDLGGGDADRHALAVGLEAVAGGDLALTALVGATLDDNLVVLAERDGADVVLLTELCIEC